MVGQKGRRENERVDKKGGKEGGGEGGRRKESAREGLEGERLEGVWLRFKV